MTPAAHTWALSTAQAMHLANACATYRAYAWHSVPPSPERNQTMKMAQAVQGRLLEAQAAGKNEGVWLTMSEEEWQAMRQVVSTLIQRMGTQPSSEPRNRLLGELAGLRLLLERRLRQTHAF